MALGITIVLTAGTSSASLGVYNPTWDGTSELRSAVDGGDTNAIIARNTSAYQQANPNETIALVLSASTPYNDDSANDVRTFVQLGGTLLVAADYSPHGNQLLRAIGADARITGTPLRDEQRAGPSPAFPRATPVANETYTTNVSSIVLNHGSTIDADGARALFRSSEYSYLDTNGNEELDSDEELSRHPVVTSESVGDGTVIVVSDPSIFLNTMLERSDNAAFARNLVTSHDTVVFDVTHTASLPPLIEVRLTLLQSPPLVFIAGTLTVILVILGYSPYNAVQKFRNDNPTTLESPSPTDVASAIRKSDWNEDRVERVTNSLMLNREENESDE